MQQIIEWSIAPGDRKNIAPGERIVTMIHTSGVEVIARIRIVDVMDDPTGQQFAFKWLETIAGPPDVMDELARLEDGSD